MMTLEVAILYHTEEAEKLKLHKRVNEIFLGTEGYKRELQEHTQTADWLRELQERRKQSEKIHCKDCRWNDGVCYCEFHYRDVKPTDYCSWAERRTDG